ncbi:MAG: beta-galactosidase trimerization domain-containing protein, partial [Lentisphaerae bacterium]|nr:beta-galactosidase trimerization domain-containing protein [Lentisphaerota bacterium]
EYDCLYGLANGMRATVGDHFHPRGDLNHAVHDLVERIYGRLRKLEPWVDGATACTDVGLVIPKPGFHRADPKLGRHAIAVSKGGTRMLCELNAQFDVLTHACSWEGYEILVLPDHVTADEDTVGRLRRHLDAGGRIITSAWSGLNPAGDTFVLPEWCADSAGDDPLDPAYFRAGAAVNENLPDMPIDFYGKGVQLVPRPGAETLAEIIAPYYNREFDGEHYSRYAPPDKPAGRPAVLRNAQVTQISHTVFSSYHNVAWWALRNLVGNLLRHTLPYPLLKAPGLPSFARVTVMKQPGRRLVHLLAYVPEHRGASVDMIEEPARIGDVQLALRHDDADISRVYLAPSEQDLEWTRDEHYIHTTVPDVRGYALIVFEWDEGEDRV